MSVGFSLLPLTGSSKIHFKLILKVRSETNCRVTGEKCQWRNAFGAAANQWVNPLGQRLHRCLSLAVCPSTLGPCCFPADCILLQSVLQCSLISIAPFLLSPFPAWHMPYSLFHFFCFSTEAVCALAFVSKFKLHTQVRVETDLITQPDVPTIGSAAIPRSVHPGRDTKGPYKYLTTGNEKEGVAML